MILIIFSKNTINVVCSKKGDFQGITDWKILEQDNTKESILIRQTFWLSRIPVGSILLVLFLSDLSTHPPEGQDGHS